jgi:UDP-N-acetylglucosamine diphosphorylase / glucose-1-phosphate thymidylyltransferase / UDP-N-acetylgalactosamine diphosphorylase / glucosamine-1-phosphate N-acetyltransferase / galactosamine-1-phosphate N-acetyltransferase
MKSQNNVKQAVIICGGKGERLGSNFSFTQKCLLPIAGRPILSYVIESLELAKIKEVILIVNHREEDVKNFLEYSKPFKSKIKVETIISDGTTGVIKKLKEHITGNFIYCHGNILYPPNWIKQLVETYNPQTTAYFGVSKIDLISTHIHIVGKEGIVHKVVVPNGKPIPPKTFCAIELTVFNQEIFNVINPANDSLRLGEALKQFGDIERLNFRYKLLQGMWVHIEIPSDLSKAASLITSIWNT